MNLISSILKGSDYNPDMYTFAVMTKEQVGCKVDIEVGCKTDIEVRVCKLNKLGYVPLVSTVTGAGRCILGSAYALYHGGGYLIDAKDRCYRWREFKTGMYNASRGLIEALPFLGNTLTILYDYRRKNRYYKNTKRLFLDLNYRNHVVVSINKRVIARKNIDEITKEILDSSEYEQMKEKTKTAEIKNKITSLMFKGSNETFNLRFF